MTRPAGTRRCVVVVGAVLGAWVLGIGVVAACGPAPARSVERPAAGSAERSAPAAPATPATAGARTSPPQAAADVVLAFAGDVHFAGRTRGRIADPASALGPIARVLAGADLAMVNLETAVTERGAPEPKQFHFRTPPSAFAALRLAGVDVVTMANNHAVDYGPVGLADTLAAIRATPLAVVGIGADARQAYAPYLATVRATRVAVLAASQIADRTNAAWRAGERRAGIASAFDLARLLPAVRAARRAADVVVVYVHWGTEGVACATGGQRRLAAALRAAGADAVVGTHAHLLLGAGWLGRTYVDYGLGNFVWWRDHAYSNDTGVLLLRLHDRRVVGGSLTPAVIDPRGLPLVATGPAARRVADERAARQRCAGLDAGSAR